MTPPATIERWHSPAEAAVELGAIVPLDGGEHPDGSFDTITVPGPAGSGPAVYGFPTGADVRRWKLESPFVRFVTSGADRLVVIYESGLFAVDEHLTVAWDRSTDLIVDRQEHAGAIRVEQMDGPTLVADVASGQVAGTS